jgi:hypothetical protein
MNHYIDIITRNHELSDFTSSASSINFDSPQTGGNKKNNKDTLKNTPTGSFPPIYKIQKKEKEEKDKMTDKTRAFAQVKTTLSIKDIMEERRDNNSQSFISL